MLSDERQAIREEMLQEQYHECKMRTDTEYFCEFTLGNFHVLPEGKTYVWLYDVMEQLKKHCDEYEQDINVLFEFIKEGM